MLLTFTAVFILYIYFMSLLYLYLCLYIIWPSLCCYWLSLTLFYIYNKPGFDGFLKIFLELVFFLGHQVLIPIYFDLCAITYRFWNNYFELNI